MLGPPNAETYKARFQNAFARNYGLMVHQTSEEFVSLAWGIIEGLLFDIIVETHNRGVENGVAASFPLGEIPQDLRDTGLIEKTPNIIPQLGVTLTNPRTTTTDEQTNL